MNIERYLFIISYYLNNEVAEPVTIEILDITGEVIRDLEGPKEAGLHILSWDLRKNPPQKKEGDEQSRMQQRYRRLPPMVCPGEYLLRLKAGDNVLTTKLVIEKDDPGYMGR